MTILQIIPSFRTGGMQRVAQMLHERLPQQGIVSRLVASGGARGGRGARIVAALGVVRDIARGRPDGVVVHTVMGSLLFLPIARLFRVPKRVVVAHGSLASLGAMRGMGLGLLDRSGSVTDIVFCGHSVAESFKGVVPGRRASLRTIQNAVPTAISPPVRGGSSESLRLLFVGRLVPGKNVSVLLKALTLTGEPVTLTVVGDGPQRGELESIARVCGVSDRVEFVGDVAYEAALETYAGADVFVFPSEVEGLPLVLLEAAAAGLAIICSDTDFNAEVLGDAATFVPSRREDRWAEAIDAYAKDPALRLDFQARAQARCEHFTPDRMVASYAEMLSVGC